MKNIVGQAPRGENFFPRNRIVATIYKRLEGQANILLSAPRRVGKTSIMRFLEDSPREGFCFVYVITESVYSPEEFYRALLKELLGSSAVSKLKKSSTRLRNSLDQLLKRIRTVELGADGLKVELGEGNSETYQDAFEALLREIDTEGATIVLMIDEFPQTVENIREKSGNQEAIHFLQKQRTFRQKSSPSLRVIYTGSIGLPSLVNKLGDPELINDLNPVEVPPLSHEEGWEMVEKLLLSAKVQWEDGVIDYLLQEISWLIPFFLQLAVQEVIDVFEQTHQPIMKGDVDHALDQMIRQRNNTYFESYYARLNDAFPPTELGFVLALLSVVANEGYLLRQAALDLAREEGVLAPQPVLEALQYDGYLYVSDPDKEFRFQSPILARWWKKFKIS